MIRKAALALSGLFLVSLMIGLWLPDAVQVSRSIEIAAQPEKVFPPVNDLRAFQRWSPWHVQGMAVTFSGPESGVGARMTWTEPDGMTGSQEIAASEPPRRVAYGLEFGQRRAAQATMELEPAGAGTRVTWGFVYRIGFDILARYVGALAKARVGDKYTEGLARLRELAERDAASP
jgi:uncharacterized protein YndB with AHSA1/START domain